LLYLGFFESSQRRSQQELPPRYTPAIPRASQPRYPILDRLYGTTDSLMDLPEPEQLSFRNRDIPPLRGNELNDTLKDLDSVDGIEAAQFWQTIDKCECERYFTKRALHDEHSQVCLYWQTRKTPSATSETSNALTTSSSSCSTTDLNRMLMYSPSASPQSPSRTAYATPSRPSIQSKKKDTSTARSPYPTFPHPSPATPPPVSERTPYLAPAIASPSPATPLTVNQSSDPFVTEQSPQSTDSSQGQDSDEMHTIRDEVLQSFLDSIGI
ncbi:MAG TPA: hypothetical protein VGO47_14945, partial [Chlamydiales bacterium]|nr:hypothetical protein [Chlamydiales bacterium]